MKPPNVLTNPFNIFVVILDENNKIIELEGRVGGLEKDVATKEAYIKELEDIMVEKVGLILILK